MFGILRRTQRECAFQKVFKVAQPLHDLHEKMRGDDAAEWLKEEELEVHTQKNIRPIEGTHSVSASSNGHQTLLFNGFVPYIEGTSLRLMRQESDIFLSVYIIEHNRNLL